MVRDSEVKKAQQRLFNRRRLKKFGLVPKTLTNSYRWTIESILLGCITAWYGNCTARNCRALQVWCSLPSASPGEHCLPFRTPTASDFTERPKRLLRTSTTQATACSPYHPEGKVHQTWDRETENQLLSQGHQIVKQPSLAQERRLPTFRLDIIGHFNKWNTSHFNNAALRMFMYLTLLISYVYTVSFTIYCILAALSLLVHIF